MTFGRVVELSETQAAACQLVKTRGSDLRPVAAQIGKAEVVGHDEKDVGAGGLSQGCHHQHCASKQQAQKVHGRNDCVSHLEYQFKIKADQSTGGTNSEILIALFQGRIPLKSIDAIQGFLFQNRCPKIEFRASFQHEANARRGGDL